MKTLARFFLRLIFGFRSFNAEVLKTPGPLLLVPNHTSWLDWLFVLVNLEGEWKFVTSATTAEVSIVHRILMVNRLTFPIDPASPYAVKRMAEYLQGGGRLVLFAEGRLSMTGTLMKLFDGTGFLLHKTNARIITAYLRGACRVPFSPHPGWKQCCPTVTTHYSELLTPPQLGHLGTTTARAQLTSWLRDQLVEQQFRVEMEFGARDVLGAIVENARHQPGHVVLEDATLTALTYRRLLVGVDLMARALGEKLGGRGSTRADLFLDNKITPVIHADENIGIVPPDFAVAPKQTPTRIGVLLPNVNATPVVLMALWSLGKVPAVLNFSTGPAVMLACAQLAGLKQIVTSRAFLEHANLKVDVLTQADVEMIYLEDVRAGISGAQKFFMLLAHKVGLAHLSTPNSQPTDTAVILFTSGSEGVPKGVELSHQNILANIRQMLAVTDLNDRDRLFNCLPLFHSFGLTVGTLLPLVRGMYVFIYPSPLHYRVVPAAFYDRDCTVFLSTNTFLAGYARKAHAYDFRSMRYLFAAAEKLQETTATTWSQRFGVRILEGYGATECSPCLSVNTPLTPCHGSVGRLLPGIEYKLEPVEGVGGESGKAGERESGNDHGDAEGETRNAEQSQGASAPTVGRLFVRGPNIMKGYLNADANATFKSHGGWYDTGDIVSVDELGYLHIRGRMKRFAKVSGEMVSLTAVEDALAGAFPHYGLRCQIAVCTRPDEEKGEALIAVSNEPKLQLDEIRAAIRAKGLTNLCVPREIKVVKEIPKLGTGKVNHRALQEMI